MLLSTHEPHILLRVQLYAVISQHTRPDFTTGTLVHVPRSSHPSSNCHFYTSARLCQKMKRTACIFAIAAASVSQAQDYGDYAGQDDNLYADYAAKQQEKAVGAGG